MNNTYAYNDLMDKFEVTGLLRTVKEVEIYMPNGEVIPNKKALMFEDDGSYISTVGKKYKVIQNEEVFSRVAESLVESGLDLEGVTVDYMGSANTGRHLAKVTFPNHTFTMSKMGQGDETALQQLFRNSHDGTWKFAAETGGFRYACTNGQVMGEYVQAYANMHTKGFNMDSLIHHLEHSLEDFDKMGDAWIRMQNIMLNETQVQDIILDYLGKKWETLDQKFKHFDAKTMTSAKELMLLWNNYRREMGPNLYAMYNVLTDYATHVGDSISPAVLTTRRSEKIIPAISQLMAA